MYSDVIMHCMSCPHCAIVNAAGHVQLLMLQDM